MRKITTIFLPGGRDTCKQLHALLSHPHFFTFLNTIPLTGKSFLFRACTLDITCLKLRDKAEVFDELEDTTAALERLMQDLMGELSRLDKTISEQKFELNTHLETISGHPSIHVGSTLGRTILQAAGAELKSNGNGNGKHRLAQLSQSSSQSSSSSDGEEPWRDNLTPEVCQALRHAATEINQATQQVAEKRDALRNIVDALSVQQASTKKARESIRMLKDKRASLEAATRYRHTMRRR